MEAVLPMSQVVLKEQTVAAAYPRGEDMRLHLPRVPMTGDEYNECLTECPLSELVPDSSL